MIQASYLIHKTECNSPQPGYTKDHNKILVSVERYEYVPALVSSCLNYLCLQLISGPLIFKRYWPLLNDYLSPTLYRTTSVPVLCCDTHLPQRVAPGRKPFLRLTLSLLTTTTINNLTTIPCIKVIHCPRWCVSFGWAQTHALVWGHMPGLWAGSTVEIVQVATDPCFLLIPVALSLSPSPPPHPFYI